MSKLNHQLSADVSKSSVIEMNQAQSVAVGIHI
jgi:hypothetical protein